MMATGLLVVAIVLRLRLRLGAWHDLIPEGGVWGQHPVVSDEVEP